MNCDCNVQTETPRQTIKLQLKTVNYGQPQIVHRPVPRAHIRLTTNAPTPVARQSTMPPSRRAAVPPQFPQFEPVDTSSFSRKGPRTANAQLRFQMFKRNLAAFRKHFSGPVPRGQCKKSLSETADGNPTCQRLNETWRTHRFPEGRVTIRAQKSRDSKGGSKGKAPPARMQKKICLWEKYKDVADSYAGRVFGPCVVNTGCGNVPVRTHLLDKAELILAAPKYAKWRPISKSRSESRTGPRSRARLGSFAATAKQSPLRPSSGTTRVRAHAMNMTATYFRRKLAEEAPAEEKTAAEPIRNDSPSDSLTGEFEYTWLGQKYASSPDRAKDPEQQQRQVFATDALSVQVAHRRSQSGQAQRFLRGKTTHGPGRGGHGRAKFEFS